MEYCKASPDSEEWYAYQIKRVLSIKELKMKNTKLEKQIGDEVKSKIGNGKINKRTDPITAATASKLTASLPYPSQTSDIPAILKKVTKRTFNSQTKDASNVTWKEPVADTKFLPVGWMKVPEVPKPQLAQTQPRKKVDIRNKISSIEESSVKGKSVTGASGKQLSITERSGKNEKPQKRNNGKNNLTKPITNVDSGDSRAAAEVKKGGKLNKNAETNITTTNLENPLKTSSMMSANTMKCLQEATVPTTGSQISSKESFSRLKQEPSTSSRVQGIGVRGAPKLFEITQNQVVVDADKNNNTVILKEKATIYPVDINYGKASTYYVPPESKQKCNHNNTRIHDETEWIKETKTEGVDNVTLYSFDDKKHLNGDAIVYAPTRKQTKKSSSENSTIATAKLFLGNESMKEEETKKDIQSSIMKPSQNLVDTNEWFIKKDAKGIQEKSTSKTQLHVVNGGNSDLRANNGNALVLNGINFGLKNKPFIFDSMTTLLNRFKPPKLPEFEVCNVLPGTSEWENYWEYFNQKIAEYYSCVEKYSKQMDDLLLDDDGFEYQKELRKRHQEETALKISMGITIPKPPLLRKPLKDTVEIGGYVIRPLGGAVAQANVSTCDHSSFRLEIPCEKVDNNLDSITVDARSNIMTIVVPSDQKRGPFMKIIQISVPKYKKVQNLQVGSPLDNGGKIIVSGK